jgi:hypothetical protein
MKKMGVSILLAFSLVLGFQTVAWADIQGYSWSSTAMTLNTGVSSNQVGFWQALLFSNGQCPTYDGIYGAQTKNGTISFQNGVLGYPQPGKPADGIVGWRTWLDTQNAVVDGFGRLVPEGNGYYHYYGGGASDAHLYWSPYSPYKWWFQSPGNQLWYIATNARTMSSSPC